MVVQRQLALLCKLEGGWWACTIQHNCEFDLSKFLLDSIGFVPRLARPLTHGTFVHSILLFNEL